MKLLITGGLGNLGSWVTDTLVRTGHDVTTFAHRDRNVLRDLVFERRFGDIRELDDLTAVMHDQNWDAVIHLASVSESDNSLNSLLINALGTRNVLDALSKSSSLAHLIYFSTFHVYGRSSGLIDENIADFQPRADYSTTHLFAEYYIRQFHYSNGIQFTTFRLTNGYGCPFEKTSTKWNLALNDLARMAIQDKAIRLRSNGKGQRDLIWLGDVCDVILKTLVKGPANRAFNLGSGKAISMLELAETVETTYCETFGNGIPINVNELDTTQEQGGLTVSIDALKNWISFSPNDRIREETRKIFELLSI